jgi:hypothetical protein
LTWAFRLSISASPSATLALSSSISLAASASGFAVAVREARLVRGAVVAPPRVESLFLGSAVVVEAAVVRVVEGRVVPVVVADAVVLAVVVLGLAVEVVEVAGLRRAGVVLLLGLEVRVLVLRDVVEEATDFFSSSLALTLGRLRWVEVVVGTLRRRVVVVGGLVGGLLRPPVAREDAVPDVAEARAAVVPVAARGRRVVVVAVPAGRLVAAVAGLVSEVLFAGASGEVAGSEGAGVDSAEGVAGASSG